MKQTILGAGGAIGIELAKALATYTTDIRLVSRNPKKVNLNDELFPADLNNREDVFKAVEGSEIIYVTVGFAYNIKIWQKLWPPFIKNVIDACMQHNAKMVFFDNIYAIGGDNVKHITEESPMSPCSKKGEVRAEVDKIILDAIENRKLNAIIARSPDFFSEVKAASMAMNLIYDNLIKGKKAQWLCDAKKVHNMGYTPDLAMGTAILGNTPDAYNQVWNLPTDSEKITGEGWINLFAKEMNTSNKYQVLPNWLIKVLGLFIPIMKELPEMNYQYDRDYFFDSSKFNSRFNYTPIKNAVAVKQTVESLSEKNTSV
ncbi:MAG: NAD(P)H-binding protein [Saprospiraceae bacterium]|nr:NAD(P)H-binding protein [Candidatus Vicinibacter affinis]MBK7800884.1 NAD(P)H-binding protein [Candidatus Vicinibacter affinis]MBK8644913.1 NAD(P)H-binding protein [Candidatus Vicinibacter affinis]MBK9643396.1 NAD(P)H-binding protein [Candidatus Vicinibacter affinis]